MKTIKIGTTSLPETIRIQSGTRGIAQLTFYPINGRWNGMYICHNKSDGTFDKFNADMFDFETIEDCAKSMLSGLKSNGYKVPKQ